MRFDSAHVRRVVSIIFVLVVIVVGLSSPNAHAETRRALLVGINQYRAGGASPNSAITRGKISRDRLPVQAGRGSWSDLEFAINDVEAMESLLQARFEFPKDNIRVLKDGDATREGILAAIESHLISAAAPGDVSVFFFAGHGSQVTNSLSDEDDKMDESIVPYDHHDIRDRELARMWRQALQKGIVLTVVFDSCHSGSISRGNPSSREDKIRSAPPEQADVKDPPDADPAGKPLLKPEEHPNFLGLSATQQDKPAMESNELKHGAFTAAMLATLTSVPANEPAANVNLAINGYLRGNARTQQPVLAGKDRKGKPLFGGVSSSSGMMTVSARTVIGDEKKEVELDGGSAIGLEVGTELVEKNPQPGKVPIRLKIIRVDSLTKSNSSVVTGDAGRVRPGALFVVDRFVVPSAAKFKVWLPSGGLDEESLQASVAELSKLRGDRRVEWVSDPTTSLPCAQVFWEKGIWKLFQPGAPLLELGRTPSADMLVKQVRPCGGQVPRLFVDVPPSGQLAKALEQSAAGGNSAIEIASAKSEAKYFLMGRIQTGAVSYAWVLPDSESAQDEFNPLPRRTDWVETGSGKEMIGRAAARLQEFALRLGKVQGWLSLRSRQGEDAFPYRLTLRYQGQWNEQTKSCQPGQSPQRLTLITSDSRIRDGECYGMVLVAEENSRKGHLEQRYVYVFMLDRKGKSQLFFPAPGAGSVENRVPADSNPFSKEIPLAGGAPLLIVDEPYGVDTYVLLTTSEALPNPEVLEFDGVMSEQEREKNRSRGRETVLSMLLTEIGSKTRGAKVPHATASNWSVRPLTVKSEHGGR